MSDPSREGVNAMGDGRLICSCASHYEIPGAGDGGSGDGGSGAAGGSGGAPA